jgi:hypothetical protein
MTTITLKYTLEQIEDIVFKGFDYQIPDDVMEKISNLAMQVGSPDYVKTPVFKKRENPMKVEPAETNSEKDFKKKRKNKAVEVFNDDEWDNSFKSFQTTKIETKTGIDADFDSIRALINKITQKNYSEICNKIVENINKLISNNSESDLSNVASNIFEIASSNRYYSEIYAQLYTDLSKKFEFMRTQYQENLIKFTGLFNNIEYVDPNENYDRFCEINKANEKRKSLAAFYMNLMNHGIISKNEIKSITRNLLSKIYEFIYIENKKNEVEELTETIGILYNKDLYENDDGNDYEKIDGFTIGEIIKKIANSKIKDYKSLTNKSLFKFMDLIDM